jgi:DNA-binding NtrC family response regulator
MAESFEALIISSERERGRILATILGEHGVVPTYCFPLDAAQTLLSRESIYLAFFDIRLVTEVYPGLRHVICSRQLRILPVIFTHPDGAETSLQIQGLEDVDFIAHPFEGAAIEQIIQKAIAKNTRREMAV